MQKVCYYIANVFSLPVASKIHLSEMLFVARISDFLDHTIYIWRLLLRRTNDYIQWETAACSLLWWGRGRGSYVIEERKRKFLRVLRHGPGSLEISKL